MGETPGACRTWQPGPPLSEFVDFFWAVDRYVASHVQERVLPTATIDLVFASHGDDASAAIAGPRSQSMVLDTSRPFSVIGVHFKPGGGFPFFGLPASELHNGVVPLEVAWGSRATMISDRLWEAETIEGRCRIIEDALLSGARRSQRRHPAVRCALDVFGRSRSDPRISNLVAFLGLSSRRFVDLFRAEVGVNPKTFCRIRRFNETLRCIDGQTEVDWADLAVACGYFDQAHLIHDFRALAGTTPVGYLRERIALTHIGLTDRSNP